MSLPLTPRTWRVRGWVRAASLTPTVLVVTLVVAAASGAMGWGSNLGFTVAMLVAFAVIPPFLAWWPKLSLAADGALSMRGWLTQSVGNVTHIDHMSTVSWGLRIEFDDRPPFTSVIFQATQYWRYPRYFDFIEAATGTRPALPQFESDWADVAAELGFPSLDQTQAGAATSGEAAGWAVMVKPFEPETWLLTVKASTDAATDESVWARGRYSLQVWDEWGVTWLDGTTRDDFIHRNFGE